jgi:hypothetical protein
MDTYEFHPFADAFPMMSDQEHEELVADIKANGLREPIMLYDGDYDDAKSADIDYRYYLPKILDGRNRYKACVEVGIEPTYVHFDGFDGDGGAALAYVISKNLVRRHLDESQRAIVAAKLSGLKPGQHADQALPIGRAATMLNVGERSVARARKVIDKGDPELVAAVERGDIAVSAAVDAAKRVAGKKTVPELAAEIEAETINSGAETIDETKEPPNNSKKTLYCSFCGKSQHEVSKLIAGPNVFICDECVALCVNIIREEGKSEPQIDPATLSESAATRPS